MGQFVFKHQSCLAMVAHAFNLSAQKAEAGVFLEVQISQSNIVISFLKITVRQHTHEGCHVDPAVCVDFCPKERIALVHREIRGWT